MILNAVVLMGLMVVVFLSYKRIWLLWSRQFDVEIIFHHEVELKILHCFEGVYSVCIRRHKNHLTAQDIADTVVFEICHKYDLLESDETVVQVESLIKEKILNEPDIDIFFSHYTGSRIDLRQQQEKFLKREYGAVLL